MKRSRLTALHFANCCTAVYGGSIRPAFPITWPHYREFALGDTIFRKCIRPEYSLRIDPTLCRHLGLQWK